MDNGSLLNQLLTYLATLICLAVAAGFSFAADPDGFDLRLNSVWVIAALSFGINWLAFIPAIVFETEKFYDLTGSITYLTCTAISLIGTGTPNAREIVLSCFVTVWTIRLGFFLFKRVLVAGKDDRFDEIKKNPIRFFNTWTIQGLWVFFTALPVFTVNATRSNKDIGALDIVGFIIWAFGFLIEAISDNQKNAFKANANNKGKWIEEGLWYYSRHPNYFGEIVLWFGVFISSISVLKNEQFVCVFSPLFVYLLITQLSGVPLLEKKSDKKWGSDPAYQEYKRTTSELVILPKGFCGSAVTLPVEEESQDTHDK